MLRGWPRRVRANATAADGARGGATEAVTPSRGSTGAQPPDEVSDSDEQLLALVGQLRSEIEAREACASAALRLGAAATIQRRARERRARLALRQVRVALSRASGARDERQREGARRERAASRLQHGWRQRRLARECAARAARREARWQEERETLEREIIATGFVGHQDDALGERGTARRPPSLLLLCCCGHAPNHQRIRGWQEPVARKCS